MRLKKQISQLMLVPFLLIGLGTPVRGDDSKTPIDVNVPCNDFGNYVSQHQADILNAVGGKSSGLEYWGATNGSYSVTYDLQYDIAPNQRRKPFHCACSGEDVDSYESECPGKKPPVCFTDYNCPAGQDCRNKVCGHAHIITFNSVGSIKSAYFQWSPQPVPQQCMQTMIGWNHNLEVHEALHNSDERAAFNLFTQNGLKLHTPEDCAPTEVELKARLDRKMSNLVEEAIASFNNEKKLLGEVVHDLMGASNPAPDCSCMSMSK